MSPDVTIVVNGRTEYPSHRLILCASSDVFQCMLMNPSWTESRENRVELKESSACANCFEDFLRYVIIRVQAENKKNTPGTFWHGIDPKKDLVAIFLTSGTVFAYHQGLLARLHKKWDKTTITR